MPESPWATNVDADHLAAAGVEQGLDYLELSGLRKQQIYTGIVDDDNDLVNQPLCSGQ